MSTIIRGYKYKIYPTEEQKHQLDKFNDLFRYVYNWGISKEEEIYDKYINNDRTGKRFYYYYDLCRLFNKERNVPENYWLKDIPLQTARLALRNVENAYKNKFKKICKNPKFKSKKRSKFSFNTRNDRFNIENNCIKIEGIKERISLGFDSGININGNHDKIKAINPVLSKDNLGNYFISFSLKTETKKLSIPKSEGIGIDVGERRTYILSSGKIFIQPKENLKNLERKRIKQQKHVQRDIDRRLEEAYRTKTKYEDIPKSKRAIKRELRLNKIYKKIHNTKNTFYNQITSYIAKQNPEFVCMETLSVDSMKKQRNVAKTLNASLYDIIQKVKFKCEQYNIPFIQAPSDFPSTKTCSNCGHIKIMKGKHTYSCPNCGMVEDRDINAAINLYNYGLEYINNI